MFVACIMKFRLQATNTAGAWECSYLTTLFSICQELSSLTFQVDSPGTVLISTLLDILALDILGLDILGMIRMAPTRNICNAKAA